MTGLAVLENASLISQGAEARIYKTTLHDDGPAILLKHRFPKRYRHSQLDASLTKQRLSGEARALVRCLKFGVSVPGVRYVDAEHGILGIEWIDGLTVRRLLGDTSDTEGDSSNSSPEDLPHTQVDRGILTKQIGAEIARMHRADIIHGDLTTSNMMLRLKSEGNPDFFLIDFGLSYNSGLAEDKAVDLYVLERAFSSTHPESEELFSAVLKNYSDELGKSASVVLKRLEEVRLRGRKRSMVG